MRWPRALVPRSRAIPWDSSSARSPAGWGSRSSSPAPCAQEGDGARWSWRLAVVVLAFVPAWIVMTVGRLSGTPRVQDAWAASVWPETRGCASDSPRSLERQLPEGPARHPRDRPARSRRARLFPCARRVRRPRPAAALPPRAGRGGDPRRSRRTRRDRPRPDGGVGRAAARPRRRRLRLRRAGDARAGPGRGGSRRPICAPAHRAGARRRGRGAGDRRRRRSAHRCHRHGAVCSARASASRTSVCTRAPRRGPPTSTGPALVLVAAIAAVVLVRRVSLDEPRLLGGAAALLMTALWLAPRASPDDVVAPIALLAIAATHSRRDGFDTAGSAL